jgi:LuxR family transcriptional activator of conjugal transfer of Ti plasmids
VQISCFGPRRGSTSRRDASPKLNFTVHHVFQKFIDRLSESHDADAFHQAMADAADAFGLSCFAYFSMPRDGRTAAALISSYPPRWTERYLGEHYERIDPVIALAHTQTDPFDWGLGTDRFELTELQQRLFDEASQFGICCGFTIPIQDGRGPVAAVTFASDSRQQVFQRIVEDNERVLQLMAIDLHAHARRKLWRDPILNGVRLSPRELECLQWAAKGKSAWVIGQILKISRRTVAFHLDNARAKLGVQNLRQAIALLASTAPPF